MRKINKRLAGFTLLETLITVGIIAVLTTITIIGVRSVRIASRDNKRLSDFSELGAALHLYYQQNGSYPTLLTAGAPLTSPNGDTTFMEKTPANPSPWADNGCPNSNYEYTVTAANKWFEVVSCIGKGESGSEIITLTPDGLSRSPHTNFSHWKFDDASGTSAADSGNLGLSLNLNGSFSWEAGENCKNGSCLTFDGVSGYGDFAIPQLPEYTVSAWVKRLSDQETEAGKFTETQILGTPSDKVGLSIQYYSEENTTDSRFLFWDGSSIHSTTKADLNTFYHVAISSDGKTKKLYINGVLEATGTAVDGILSGSASVGRGYAGDRFLNATIDDLRFYNRALSVNEINKIYQGSL